MEIDLFSILAALAGGFFGAAIGSLHAFVFTGVLVIVGFVAQIAVPDAPIISSLAFGPAFGPHIAFAGGVAATAYAARRGYMENGKDIVLPLAALAKPDVLAVGAVFGLFGYFVQKLIAIIPGFGAITDSVALTVVISAILARVLFGRTKVFARNSSGKSGFDSFEPNDAGSWIRAQESFGINTALGVGAGLFASFISITLLQAFPEAANASTFVFGISALSLILLSAGQPVPVTHHITLPASIAAATFYPLVGENAALAIIIGAAAGVLGAWFGELFARLWQSHGDTHIDPPAAAIWPATTIVLGLGAVLGAAG